MTKNTIVGDSSPLIALAIIGQLELLVKTVSARCYSRKSLGRNHHSRREFTRRYGNQPTGLVNYSKTRIGVDKTFVHFT